MTLHPSIPPRICILRLSAIGDVTHAIAAVKTLQAARPDAQITWVIGRLEHKLLQGLPGVHFAVYDKSAGRAGVRQLRQALGPEPFDALLHMQVSLRSNLVSRAIRAKRRIGYDRARSRDFHGLFVNERIPAARQQHVLDSFIAFARQLGADVPVLNQDIPVSAEDRAWAKAHLHPDRLNVVISPCSSHPLRNWRSDRYAAIADELARLHGARVMLCGGPSDFERRMAADIQALAKTELLDLTGQDTLKQFHALLSGADLLISPDSGPAHMASCAGTPVIALHAASNPLRSGPYHFLDLAVNQYPAAAQRFLGQAPEALKWGTKIERPGAMDLITLDMVREKIALWLQRRDAPTQR